MATIKQPKDQETRDKITGNNTIDDLKCAQFVKAGAGAGKTSSIKDRVLNLVSKAELSPERMVIITYTTKAANELMTRIREIMESNLQLPNVEDALAKLTDSKISTFHAFCYDLLKEYPIEFCIDPELELADEKTTEIMLENCFDLMLQDSNNQESESRKLFASQMDTFLNLYDSNTPDSLKQAFLSLYQNRDLSPIKIDNSSLKDIDTLEKGITQSIGEYYNLVKDLYANIKSGKETDKMYVYMQESLINIINSKTEEQFVEYICDNRIGLIKGVGAQGAYKDPQILKDLKACAKLVKADSAYIESVIKIQYYNDALEVYPYFESVVEDYKALYGFIDFFDCLYLVKKKLDSDDHLRKLIQERFDIVIIDEFQDSDPMQADIAFHLAGKNTDKLFFVGDPKQSIYGFSRADISVYLEVMDRISDMGNGEVLELTSNFRSSGGLLDFINANFEKILIRSEERKDVSVDYTPMEKCEKKKDLPFTTEHWKLNYLLDEEAELPFRERPNKGVLRPREAYMVASQVKVMMDEQGLTPGDFLILFRSGTSMEAYEKALKELNIPVLNTKSKNFLKRNEVIELLNLLALSAFPKGQNGKFYRFCVLESDLLNISEESLNIVLEKDWSFEDKFRELCNIAGFTSLAIESEDDLYLQFIENLCSLAKTELVANNYDLKRTFHNLFEKAVNDSYFSAVKVSDESVNLQTKKANAVTLMTIHSSKGLESKVVIMSAFESKPFEDRQYVDRHKGEILIDSPFLSSKLADGLELTQLQEYYNKEGVRREEEEKRVLYVGVTRAEEQFILISKEDGENTQFISTLLDVAPEFKETIELDFNKHSKEYETREIHHEIECSNKAPVYKKEVLKSLINTENSSKSVSTLIEDSELFMGIEGRKNGQAFGTFTHLVMEYLCSIIYTQKNIEIDTNLLISKLYDQFGIKLENEYIENLKAVSKDFLKSSLATDIISADAIYTELPFSSEDKYHGIIDLIVENEEKIRVIDFKSDLLKTKKEEIKAHYKKQVDMYVKALESKVDKNVVGECLYLFEEG
ncbi:exodeoxyribonuclease V subunit beta [Halobacteriovorax sp. HLS]|uniref:UvrD-helicase domain-containing protein n=1 Tax=Halobacteriovorax sp. HLS TaxID=2234000 RepID=UPI000FDB5667|nr:UvrD-helicase domain-containing protein [Halobacteriovorax sp. HLS]